MDQKLRDDTVPAVKVGELTGSVNSIINVVNDLKHSIDGLREDSNKFTNVIDHMNRDIREIRAHMEKKPSKEDVQEIVRNTLTDVGLDKESLEHVNAIVKAHKKRQGWYDHTAKAAIVVVVLGALAWIGGAAVKQITEDVHPNLSHERPK